MLTIKNSRNEDNTSSSSSSEDEEYNTRQNFKLRLPKKLPTEALFCYLTRVASLSNLESASDIRSVSNMCRIICDVFCSILLVNFAPIPRDIHLVQLQGPVSLGEPARFAISKDLCTMRIVINCELIKKYLGQPSRRFTIAHATERRVCEQNAWLKSTFSSGGQRPPSTRRHPNLQSYKDIKPMDFGEVKSRLFVVADHLATHYFDLLVTGKEPDWIDHEEFGKSGALTLHCAYKLSAANITTPRPTIEVCTNIPGHNYSSRLCGSNGEIGIGKTNSTLQLPPLGEHLFGYDPTPIDNPLSLYTSPARWLPYNVVQRRQE